MKGDRMAWVVGGIVVAAFILLICAWVFFFWLAANNRVADVPLETSVEIRLQSTNDAPLAAGAKPPLAGDGQPTSNPPAQPQPLAAAGELEQ